MAALAFARAAIPERRCSSRYTLDLYRDCYIHECRNSLPNWGCCCGKTTKSSSELVAEAELHLTVRCVGVPFTSYFSERAVGGTGVGVVEVGMIDEVECFCLKEQAVALP